MRFDPYTRLHLWLSSHRKLVLVAMLLITAAAVAVSSRIDLEEDILGILPQRDQTVDDYKYALRKFRQIDRVYLDVGLDSAHADTLAGAADEVFAGLSANPALTRIMYRLEPGGQRKVLDFLTGALPNLFTRGSPSSPARTAPAPDS